MRTTTLMRAIVYSHGASADVFKLEEVDKLFPESGVFVLNPVFILLAIFNIGGCAIPTSYLSTLVFKGISNSQSIHP